MLPIEVGNLVLSDDSRLRVDTYFHRFCTGENGQLYGLEHMVFACHAAFPLVLSPRLANLIWLNFNTFMQDGAARKVSAVVVSDFLLSSLVRPVANRQYEMFPEIRTYLLYLLKSGHWFSSFGIGRYADDRLQSLAHFLHQYCADNHLPAEHNMPAFREANQWAALAYLEPEALAFEVAAAFQQTFDPLSDQTDTHRQLQLNGMLDRLGQQIGLAIHQNEVTEQAAFVNLHRYSQANRAHLFDVDAKQVSDLYYQLDNGFIEELGQSLAHVELPIQPQFRDRLERKKSGKTRVFSIIIAPGETFLQGRGNTGQGPEALARWFGKDVYPSAAMADVQFLGGRKATYAGMMARITSVMSQARPEDALFICLSGSFGWGQAGMQFLAGDESHGEGLTPDSLAQLLGEFSTIQQIVLVLDGETDWLSWRATDAVIIASAQVVGNSRQSAHPPPGYLSELLASVLEEYPGDVSFRDLQLLLSMAYQDRWHEKAPPPIVYVPHAAHGSRIALSYAAVRPWTDPIIAYRHARHEWVMLDDGFRYYAEPLSVISGVLTYTDDAVKPAVRGFVDRDRESLEISENQRLLNPRQLYKPIIERPVYFSLEGYESDPALHELVRTLERAPVPNYSLGHAFYESPDIGRGNRFRIFARDSDQFDVHFFAAGQGDVTCKWRANGEKGLVDSILAFSRYQYVNNLQSPPSIEVIAGWERQMSEAMDHRLEECFDIVDGKVRIKPFHIELRSWADEPVYAALYALSANDFSVKRVSPPVLAVAAGEPLRHTVKDAALFLQALRQGTALQFKVFTHCRPCFPELEQAGVSIVPL